MLIVALSGRSLAAAARAAGYRPLVADLFGDLDTRLSAEAVEVVQGGLRHGLTAKAVNRAARSLARGRDPVALVYGSGFDARPATLSALRKRWPFAGNEPALVEELKRPSAFAALCASLDVPHPQIRRDPPRHPEGWLRKRAGGSGGAHVHPAEADRHARGDYYQRRVDGETISLSFLANGLDAAPLGFTRQWADPAPGSPFRYGGAVRLRPSDVPDREAMKAVARKFARHGLKGLNSADFLVSAERWWLLEINPRPGASFDVFSDRSGELLEAHVRACAGELPKQDFAFEGFRAAAVVYASRAVSAIPAIDWPEWSADRQPPGTTVAEGEPLCTALASGPTADAAVSLVAARGRRIRVLLEGG
jgi:predicted ATP-grasp superfamily ATP-dependent carboligase